MWESLTSCHGPRSPTAVSRSFLVSLSRLFDDDRRKAEKILPSYDTDTTDTAPLKWVVTPSLSLDPTVDPTLVIHSVALEPGDNLWFPGLWSFRENSRDEGGPPSLSITEYYGLDVFSGLIRLTVIQSTVLLILHEESTHLLLCGGGGRNPVPKVLG